MAEKKQCVHCRRSIDTAARICPYCNRDQDLKQQAPAITVPLPPIDAAPPAKPARRFSRDRWSTRALLIAAVLALLMATFAVGGLVYGLGKRGDTSIGSRRTAEAAEALDRGGRDLPGMELVADSSSTIGRPLTSAPMPDSDQQVPAEFQRSDATALPSAEYARLLEESSRQQQEQQQPPEQPASVDPRTVKTELPGAGVRPPAPPSGESREDFPPETREESEPAPRDTEPEPAPRRERERAHRTEPVPIYQPLPRIKDREEEIQESGTMRFRLTVDRDGEVKEIRVIETMPGMTGKMIAAMQRWKFKPATENGVPVEGTFMVDISFNAPQ